MKLAQLLLIIFTIISNEVMIELVVSDDYKISILESAEESADKEKTELEIETEAEFVTEYALSFMMFLGEGSSLRDGNISNVTNPFLEVHSPPPDFF